MTDLYELFNKEVGTTYSTEQFVEEAYANYNMISHLKKVIRIQRKTIDEQYQHIQEMTGREDW